MDPNSDRLRYDLYAVGHPIRSEFVEFCEC